MSANCSFYLGRVVGPDHEQRLRDVAHWLEQNKFATTVSIVDGRMLWDIDPHSDTPMSDEEFRIYAAEHIIHSLSHRMRDL